MKKQLKENYIMTKLQLILESINTSAKLVEFESADNSFPTCGEMLDIHAKQLAKKISLFNKVSANEELTTVEEILLNAIISVHSAEELAYA